MTELPVLGDDLAVAAAAVAGVGAVSVDAAALPFAGVGVALVHVWRQEAAMGGTAEDRRRRDQIQGSNRIPALFTFQGPDFGSDQRGPRPSGGRAEPRLFTVR